jgi:hypothetical protein
MVRRRAGMVMVRIMRCRGMQEAGCNAERRQSQEHTIGCAQAQGPQPAPVSEP